MSEVITKVAGLILAKGIPQFLADPKSANKLYGSIPTSVGELYGLNTFLSNPRQYRSPKYEMVAKENTYGLAKAIAEDGISNVVSKLKSKAITTGGFKYSETVNYNESELADIMAAQEGSANDLSLQLAAESFATNAQQLQDRLAMGLEKTFWDGVYLGKMTIDIQNGTSIEIFTETTIMTPLLTTAKWDEPTTCKPTQDLTAMDREFRGSGYKSAVVLMNQATYDNMAASASFLNILTPQQKEDVSLGNVPSGLGKRKLTIIDQTYQLTSGGALFDYLPDGYVTMVGTGGAQPVSLIELLNLDSSTGQTLGATTGGWFKTILDTTANTTMRLQQSFKGLIAFENPRAFVTLKVY